MKQLWRVSPSAVSKVKHCERATALGWVTPKGEETEKQRLGIDLHQAQEDYLNTGKAHDRTTRAGKMAMAGLPYMPGPRTGRAEGETELMISGIRYVIYVDYAGPSDLIPGAPPGMPATLDHKTSSNPSQYGLWGNAAFLVDPQALTYSVRMLVKHPDATTVFNRWIYYNTQRKSVATPSDAVLKREDVVQAFGEIVHPAAVRLIVLQNQVPADDISVEERLAWANTVPANAGASCHAYGGCQHMRTGACKLTTTEKLSACAVMQDDAKIKYDKPAPVVATVVEGKSMSTDLFAKLTANLPIGGKPGNGVNQAKAAVPADALADLQGAVESMQGAAKKALAEGLPFKQFAKQVTPVATPVALPDPINPPEKPEIVPPAKGADLVAHLQVKGVHVSPAPLESISGMPKENGPVAAKTPSPPPKASKDVLLAEPTDEELGRALRVLARFVRSL